MNLSTNLCTTNGMTMKKKKKGFTLIELIVVIAILGILAAIAIPRFSSFQGNANKKATLSTLRSIDTAIGVIAADKNLDLSTVDGADDIDPSAAVTLTLNDAVLAQLGFTAYPTTSPKGVTYSIVNGEATATVAASTPWVGALAGPYVADDLK